MSHEETFEVIIGNQRIIAYENIRGWDLKPGDMYIGKRNTGWQLAKCGKVHTEPHTGWVDSDPFGAIYSYDCGECHKVKEIIPLDTNEPR